MKIKDVTEGVMDGVKNIGKGLGQVAGGAAKGALRGLDKLGGGTGQIGTKAQQAAYAAANKAKKMAGVSKELPKEALAEFEQFLTKFGVDLADARTFNPSQIEAMMKSFAMKFFGGGDKSVAQYINHASTSVPVPTTINKNSALQYFTRINQLRDDAAALAANQVGAGQAAKKPGMSVAPGMSLVNNEPPIVNYNKKNYTLDDNGFWENDSGERIKDAYQNFLYQQAALLIPDGSISLSRGREKYNAEKAAQTNDAAIDSSATTQSATPAAPKPAQVKVGNEVITKGEDGRWYDQAGEFIGDPNDIAELERRANKAPASAGAYVK